MPKKKKRKSTKSRKRKSRKTKSSSKRRKKKQTELEINPKVIRSIAALLFYTLTFMLILSFFNQGVILQAIKRISLAYLGWGIAFLPLIFIFAGNLLLKPDWKISRPTLLLGSIILCVCLISLTKPFKRSSN